MTTAADIAYSGYEYVLGYDPLVSYPDPNVRNDDYRLQYNITYAVLYNAYVRLGLGTRLMIRCRRGATGH